MKQITVITAICATTLLALAANAGTPEDRCRTALHREYPSLHPTPAQVEAGKAAAKQAYMVCRSKSIPADLRAASVRQWAIILSQRDKAAAEALYRQTIREIESNDGPDSPALIPLLNGLMTLVMRASGGPTGEVSKIAHDVARIAEKAYGSESEPFAEALLGLGWYYELTGSRATAEALYRDGIAAAAAACAPKCGTLAAGYGMLADLIKVDPARHAEADDLDNRAVESLPED